MDSVNIPVYEKNKKYAAGACRRLLDPVVIPITIIVSGSFLYPFMGIIYLIMKPSLWGHLFGFIILHSMLTVFIYLVMFYCLYPIHAVLGVALNGPSGIFTSGISVAFESSVVASILSNWILLPGSLGRLFDSVLTKEGYQDLVMKGQLRRSLKVPLKLKIRIFLTKIPMGLFLPFWIFKILFIFLLNFIPVVGPILLIIILGPKKGAVAHRAYFQMRGFDKRQRKLWIRRRKGAYIGFGIITGIFTSLPLIGLLFNFTNCVGAALWARDFERKRSLVESSTTKSSGIESQLERILGLDTR